VAVAIADRQLRVQVYDAVRAAGAQLLCDLSEFRDNEELGSELERSRPDILLMEVSGLPVEFADATRQLRARGSAPGIIAVHTAADPGAILGAMRAGVNEYLYPPFGPEFAAALERAEAERSRDRDGARGAGRLIACCSSKGGCGATTIACHTAVSLRRAGKETLLADLDFTAGVAAMCIEAKPKYTLADALASLSRLDLTLWKALVTRCEDGLELMPPPPEPVEFAPIAPALRSLLRFWRSRYEFTVIDLGRGNTPALTGLASEFDEIVLVTTEEAAALRMTSRVIDALGAAKENRLRLVVNRVGKRPALPTGELQRLMNWPVFGSIPLDVAEGRRDGVEIRAPRLDTPLGAAVAALTAKLTGLAFDTGKRRFSFFGGGR
jgi:pilus assembly protein CpaE